MSLSIKCDPLYLRYPINCDAEQITALLQEKEIALNLGRMPWPYQLSDAQWWINHTQEAVATNSEHAFVILHPDHGLIGSTGLMRVHAPGADDHSEPTNYWEIGYWLGKPYWGNGYITQAASALLDWAQNNLYADGFISGHIEDNPASGHILKKLGFKEVGTAEHYARGRDCTVRAKRYTRGAPADIALDTSHFDDPNAP